jgi:hypothetical protein
MQHEHYNIMNTYSFNILTLEGTAEVAMLAQIDLRIEDSREDPGVLEEVVPRRRLGGAVGQGSFCGQPRDEVFRIDDGGGRKARPCCHKELHPTPSSI